MQENGQLLQKIGETLTARGLFLCTAESCTGGLLSHIITNLPGASNFYLGGQVTYSNVAKQHWLRVPASTISRHGAVSEETVLAMAQGIRAAFALDISLQKLVGISISGIAGPTGGSPQKPVGTVWIGISMPDYDHAYHKLFHGDRAAVKSQSAHQALALLLQVLTLK